MPHARAPPPPLAGPGRGFEHGHGVARQAGGERADGTGKVLPLKFSSIRELLI
jgi:hypothetical protein